MNSQKYNISIVVPVYNSKNTLKDCVQSLLNSDFEGTFEIIVVDDGSTDNSLDKIKNLDILVIYQKNKGSAAARNNGSRYAKSNLLLFVDSDVCFFKDTLKKIYGHLKKDNVDHITVRYSRKSLNQKWIHKYKALADYVYYYDFIFSREQKQKPIKQVFISGGIMGFKKNVFEVLGGFDEKMEGACVEEEKLFATLLKDYNVVADGNIETSHYFPDFCKLTKSYFDRTFRTIDIVFKDNYRQPYLKSNTLRIVSGALTAAGLFISVTLFLIFGYTLPFMLTVIFSAVYLFTHLNMFILAAKDHGLLFTLYTLIINLFFCALIGLAGCLGTIKHLLRK